MMKGPTWADGLGEAQRTIARGTRVGGVREPIEEDWERAVAVVAHPDDLEYGAASVLDISGQGDLLSPGH